MIARWEDREVAYPQSNCGAPMVLVSLTHFAKPEEKCEREINSPRRFSDAAFFVLDCDGAHTTQPL
jgi:hypothetical protein